MIEYRDFGLIAMASLSAIYSLSLDLRQKPFWTVDSCCVDAAFAAGIVNFLAATGIFCTQSNILLTKN
jgi:hypothetical protein